MPRNYQRSERVEKLAKEVLGEALQSLKDPRIGFATVTSVKMSPDLRHAKVFISALGTEDERQDTVVAIQHATPHLRSILGSQIRLKHLPILEVLEDQTAQFGERIEELLRSAAVSKPPEIDPLEEAKDE